jgi:DNA-binding response OmpR family regulator
MILPQPTPGDKNGAVRVLIVEDEPMIAFGIEDILLDAGFAIAGVATKLENALTLIESGDCDAAIVDANLAGVSADPAAIALTARGLPFIVLSGYSQEQLKSVFASTRFLQKPCRPELLIETLTDILPQYLNPRATADASLN